MPRIKKESELFNCRLEKSISEDVSDFCKKTGLTKTATVERALKMYIEYYNRTGKI